MKKQTRKVEPEVSEHFRQLQKKSWAVRKAKILKGRVEKVKEE